MEQRCTALLSGRLGLVGRWRTPRELTVGWWGSQGIFPGLVLEGRCLEVALDLGLEGQTQVSLSNRKEEAFQAEGPASAKIRTQEAVCWMWSKSRCEKRGGWNVVGKWRSPAL